MKNYIAILFTVLLTFSACSKESDFSLSQSVFIEDSECPGLPVYSEEGYNTFGMYIDRQKFVSDSYNLPVKIIVNPDTCKITLTGNRVMRIFLIGYAPTDYEQLISLNDSIIDLKSDKCIVILDGITLKVIEGKMHVKRAQKLFVDNQFQEIILSGTINFKTFRGDEPIAVTYGRFDLGISDNFYYY